MNSLRSLASLVLLSSSLAGCWHGPKLTWCLSRPDRNDFRCRDEKTDKKFTLAPEKVVNWTCMQKEEIASLYDACVDAVNPPARNQCQVGPKEKNYLFRCFDQKAERGFDLPYAETKGLVCTSVNDFLFLIKYCDDKRTRKEHH